MTESTEPKEQASPEKSIETSHDLIAFVRMQAYHRDHPKVGKAVAKLSEALIQEGLMPYTFTEFSDFVFNKLWVAHKEKIIADEMANKTIIDPERDNQ